MKLHLAKIWYCFCFFVFGSINSSIAETYSVTSTNDSGAGSLREAIMLALSNCVPATIRFSIPGDPPFIIKPATKYPPITVSITIDGTTQSQYAGVPVIQIDGSACTGDGLMICGGNSTVKGLAIVGCTGYGIRLSGLYSNVLQSCYIGVDVTGAAAGNSDAGVYVYRSRYNLIGGTNASDRNLISGGNLHGIELMDAAASNNVVCGNFIGTDSTGTEPLGNKNIGVLLAGAPKNVIGGVTEGARNVISGNGQGGVYLYNPGVTGQSTNNYIQGNFIGVDVTGTMALSNALNGIVILGCRGNTIGGTNSGVKNVISGNGSAGIVIQTNSAAGNWVSGNYIGTDVTGMRSIPNQTNGVLIAYAPGNTIGGISEFARNVISGNKQMGVAIVGLAASNTCVYGNYIGVNSTGTTALPNTWDGIDVESSGTLIGGSETGAGNVVSGNLLDGIFLSDTGGNYTSVQGNRIGTDASGQKKVGNGRNGVFIQSIRNTIGGTADSAGNVISANTNYGIYVSGASARYNVVVGNKIGTDVTGTLALGNQYSGINVYYAPQVQIGGKDSASRNLISGNLYNGIDLTGIAATNSIIQGNYIGVDVTGMAKLSNVGAGIYIASACSNMIGGAVAGAGNLISGNLYDGIYFYTATNNLVQGNYIGTQADGVSSLGNLNHGIELDGNSYKNTIGGDSALADNRIAYAITTGYDGIRVRSAAVGNFISRNSIFKNGNSSMNGLGIDCAVDGVTTNGLAVLTNCYSASGETYVAGMLKSTASKTFLIQFYSNAETNVSGYGEGETYLGALYATTDASGNASFGTTFSASVSVGQFISATVTDGSKTTGEFSRNILVQGSPSIHVVANLQPKSGETSAGKSVTGLTMSWSGVPGVFALVETTNLTTPITWTVVTNASVILDGVTRITLPVTNGTARFYQLRSLQ